MKSIVIFGATGTVGLCALRSAIDKGYSVRAFVRDKSKIPDDILPKVEVCQGDATSIDDVTKAVKDQDAVVVVLGTRNNLDPTTELSRGMENILSAMKSNNVKHLSVCLSAFLYFDPEKVPARFVHLNGEHQKMYDSVRNSDCNWVAVLPPHFTETPRTEFVVKYDCSPGRSVSIHDLGFFLVDCLFNDKHYRKSCGIMSPQ